MRKVPITFVISKNKFNIMNTDLKTKFQKSIVSNSVLIKLKSLLVPTDLMQSKN